jgi:hypothetical protein
VNEDEHKKLDALHDYFMKPELPGKKTRAQEIDDLLAAARAGKITARAILWTLGFIAATGAAWGAAKGWFSK